MRPSLFALLLLNVVPLVAQPVHFLQLSGVWTGTLETPDPVRRKGVISFPATQTYTLKGDTLLAILSVDGGAERKRTTTTRELFTGHGEGYRVDSVPWRLLRLDGKTLVIETEGVYQEKPARIREVRTLEKQGATLLIRREVRYFSGGKRFTAETYRLHR